MPKRAGSLESLIEEISRVHDEYDRARGKKPRQRRRPPATPGQIAAVERSTATKLPADYVQFLRLHDGWENFHADYSLLSTADILKPTGALGKRIAELNALLKQLPATAQQNPLIILAGENGNTAVYFDRSKQTPDGNMPAVEWDPGGEILRHRSFTDYLRNYKEFLAEQLESERKHLRH